LKTGNRFSLLLKINIKVNIKESLMGLGYISKKGISSTVMGV